MRFLGTLGLVLAVALGVIGSATVLQDNALLTGDAIAASDGGGDFDQLKGHETNATDVGTTSREIVASRLEEAFPDSYGFDVVHVRAGDVHGGWLASGTAGDPRRCSRAPLSTHTFGQANAIRGVGKGGGDAAQQRPRATS